MNRCLHKKLLWGMICGVMALGSGCQSQNKGQTPPPAKKNAPVAAETAAAPELAPAKFREEADGLKNKIGGRNVVVYFEKHNCQACADMYPVVMRAAQNFGLSVMRIIPTREEIISFGIGNYPTTVLYMGGEERQRWLGAYHEERFAREFAQHAR